MTKNTREGISTGSRLVSLDVFRGATVAGMILVNNPGSWSHIYGPLKHAAWHGWTPTDLVFPFFLFIVGVSIVLAFTKAKAKGATDSELLKKSLIRAAKIFGLGLALTAFPYITFDPSFGVHPKILSLRIPGVLQRIAVCYALASLIFLYVAPRIQAYLLAGLLLGYWALMTLVPVPGYGPGALDSTDGNLAAYLDQLVLTGHMWKKTWDPEGILSTLPALGTTLLGVWTGRILLKEHASEADRTLSLLIAGFVLTTLGYLWGWSFPINKNLWTSSYTLFTGGLAMSVFALCYWYIDVNGRRKGTQWAVDYGMNAITVFFLSGIVARTMTLIKFEVNGRTTSLQGWLYNDVLREMASPINASLLHAFLWILMFYGLATVMRRKGIILKV